MGKRIYLEFSIPLVCVSTLTEGMRIILATAHPYIPQIAGGAQSNMHEMAITLIQRGHQVSVVAGLTGDGLLGIKARIALKLGRAFHVDHRLGYPVIRTWFPWDAVESISAYAKPDIVIAQSGFPARLSEAFRSIGIPTVIHLHNVEADDLVGVSASSADAFLANSQFTAARAAAQYGIRSTVIVPSFIRDRYVTERSGNYVTMINPHQKKGVEKMLEIVRKMPGQQFLFVKAWTLTADEEAALLDAADTLPNLTLNERTSDMREVYAKTKVLAVPSVWEEAWGRVATEAQFSGIPVVGSDRGGIPEAIGPGGIVLSADADSSQWVSALSSLLDDPVAYAKAAKAALDHSQRDEIDLGQQMTTLEGVCQHVIAKRAQSA
ncbi:glycosyltransferase [Novosphingobium sp.]|uniref:glycosyltransferase n=1 Tax=Novosphingobium sp. TaxID=1874826 RepID=UPI0035662CDF